MVSSQGSETFLTMKKAGLKVGFTTLQYFKKGQETSLIFVFLSIARSCENILNLEFCYFENWEVAYYPEESSTLKLV